MARKSLSKKLRFDVFKRDGFICQYCGRTPPSAILEIDHIDPVSKGGCNHIDNLATACFDCNRGKGASDLDVIPLTIEQKSKIIDEKETQLREYKKIIKKKKRRLTTEFNSIHNIYKEATGYNLRDSEARSVKVIFLSKLIYDDVEDAMHTALAQYAYDSDRAWKYFCGICWNKIKGPSR